MNRSQLITALILGDGCIEVNPSKNSKYGKPYRIAVSCSDYYCDYYEWKKKQLLSCFNSTEFVEYYNVPKNSSNTKPSWKLTTKAEVQRFYDFLYTDGKKDLKKYIDRIIMEPKCLAIWFMDDGGTYNHKNRNRDGNLYFSTPVFFLSTNSDPKGNVEYAVKKFKEKGWECTITACDKKLDDSCNWKIDFRASASIDIWNTIKPYVYEVGKEMLWKFRLPYLLYDLHGSRNDLDFKLIDKNILERSQCEISQKSIKCERRVLKEDGSLIYSTWDNDIVSNT